MLPTIAIVGRPNVGKSTLFNRFTQTRAALVGDIPGLTRDRQYGFGEFAGRSYILIDTGGIADFSDAKGLNKGDKKEKTIEQHMTKQAWHAVEEAQAVLFLVDARSGLTAADEEIAIRLRKLNKKVYLVANKIDGLDVKSALLDFYSLGLGSPHGISAEHKVGIKELQNKIILKLPQAEDEKISDKKAVKIAFIGRPNVGKSTLVNRILGEERVIVSDQAGTTRDSIFVEFTRHGKEYVLIDTAGIRRRGKVSDKNEKFSVIKALQAIEEANVVVLLLDAQENITDQDLKLLDFALEAGRAIVIAINKWDGLEILQRDKIRSELDRRLGFIDFARLHFISALHGTGVGNLFASIDEAFISATKQLKTPAVTKILHKAIEDFPPPLVKGRRIKLRYAHVGGHNPPLIVIHGNQAEEVPANYRKYLERIFRDKLKLFGTPIRIEFRTSYNPYLKLTMPNSE